MTPDRSLAYRRVTKTLEDLGPAKLHDLERHRIRAAADTLLFAAAHDRAAFDALTDVETLTRTLVEAGRWTAETAGRLADDVADCGPSITGALPVLETSRAA